ncbi:MAG TPA: dephospho-CoA kinase [Thermoanaerobaculia bacterium]|nr:dephospho-CoA kinase [Thermoanaerobaculia bacterium]
MDLYGLTGNIGTGKSTVAKMLGDYEILVVYADEISRQATARGAGELAEIVALFGRDMIDPEGELDRRRLAKRVFADPAARRQLEEILHPAIVRRSRARFAELAGEGHGIAVYESPLLFETGRHAEMAGVILVTANRAVCLARVMARDGLAPEEIEARLAAQQDDGEKKSRADYRIENDGDLEHLRSQVKRLVARLQERAGDPVYRGGPPA